MAQQIFAYIIHKDGVADDTALEMITAAGKIDADASVTAVIAGSGAELDGVCKDAASSYAEVWKIDNEALAYINAEVIRPMLARILPKESIVLVPHEHFGMDLSPGLSVKLDAAYLPDAVDFDGIEDGKLKAVREEFGGQVSTHVFCDISQGAVITIRPGSFKADESKSAGGNIVDKTAEAMEGGLAGGVRRFLEIAEAEVGDVDITKSDVLVSVGRGIEDEDNLEIIFDLAKAMGADVSCSRPIVDAKWLEKSRQVGTSGKTV
ncbi:MAG TPA: electron transfer flavoprotein subunit alpha/FixB family protein, partial [Desulfobacterales bacterium]|nr:electron transfer flavoprotein subunit alpha/FixB family protein [Desulfobacterales bacterium]